MIKIRETGAKKPTKKRRRAATEEGDITEYLVPHGASIYVKIGDTVARGQQLYEGPLDLREILAYRGVDAVIHYIVNEVQKIYVPEGAVINDKHIEVIVRQMLSRVTIKDQGDTDFMPSEIVEKQKFIAVNRATKREKKQASRAVQKIFGITRVALTTESFLSAASFQETARVLVDAAIQGKTDVLYGLKENVIIGKLIPVGTGWRGFPEDRLAAFREKLTGPKKVDTMEGEAEPIS